MHKNAAMKYSSLTGEVDLLLNQSAGYKTENLARIKEKWGAITENAPLLPRRKPAIGNKRDSDDGK